MADLVIETRSWHAFGEDPLPSVHVDYVSHSLLPLHVQDARKFRAAVAEPHGRAWIIGLLSKRYHLPVLSALRPSRDDSVLAALSTESWQIMKHACGLMAWAPMLAREVRAPVLRQLDLEIGASWWDWVELGLREPMDNHAAMFSIPPVDPQEWMSRIQQAGNDVLRVWRDGLDADLAKWVTLKEAPHGMAPSDTAQMDSTRAKRLLSRLKEMLAINGETA